MLKLSISTINPAGSEVATTLEFAGEADLAATAARAYAKLQQHLQDEERIASLALEESDLRASIAEDREILGMARDANNGTRVKDYTARIDAAVTRLEAVRNERAALYARNA